MIDPDATRLAFTGLIEKPVLTDTLLSRPPFKFLLDVIANTISSTGYLKNQFPKSDLDPNALADKAAKTAFLDKLIAAVDDGSLKSVKSTKIVAGKEPELTNKFLLKFAENARAHMSGGPADKKAKDKNSEKSKEKDTSKKSSKEKSSRSESKDRKKDSKSKENEKDTSSSRSKSKERPKDKKHKDESKKSKDKEKSHKKKSSHKEEDEPVPESNVSIELDRVYRDLDEGFEETHQDSPHQLPEKMSPGNDSGIVELDGPPIMRTPVPQFERPTTAAARPQTSMGRPGTAAARPAPPKIKKKVIATTEETPIVAESTIEIMAEESPKEDEKEDLFIEEAIEEENHFASDASATQIEAEEGGLVQKMMETKAGLEEGQLLDDLDEDDTEFQREANKLQELQKTLQNITRTTYPLAHIFEFAQEDLEAMIRELEKWRAEVRANEAELKEKEAIGVGEAQKLTTSLTNLEEEIRNIKITLNNCKARIVANEEHIQLLIKDI